MANRATIQLQGPLIAVSADGQVALPQEAIAPLAAQLTFTYNHFEHGGKLRHAQGEISYVDAQVRRQYQFDDQGRFCCLKGFLPRVRAFLQQHKYEVVEINKNPAPRGEVYTPCWDNLFHRFSLRPRQDVCLAAIASHAGGVIDAVTAFGKTHMMAMIATIFPRAKFDIITEGKDNVARLVDDLTRWVPAVGQIGCGKNRIGRVTIYSADSIHKSDYSAHFLLGDECHTLVTDNRVQSLSRYWYSRNFGFTATTDTRFDNLHHRLEGLFGPTIFKLDYPTAVDLGLVVPINVRWLDVEISQNPIQLITNRTERKRVGIWRNQHRNQVIAAAARELWQQGKQVLLLVDTVEHALFLRRELPEFRCCWSEAALQDPTQRLTFQRLGVLDPMEGSITAEMRDNYRRAFERREMMGVIATNIWSTGVSFDGLEVLGRCAGGQSATVSTQGPGRVCRIETDLGKEGGIVLDCMDHFDRKMLANSMSRRRDYGKHQWTQIMSDGSIWKSRAWRPKGGSTNT